jgi:hypothetical protein
MSGECLSLWGRQKAAMRDFIEAAARSPGEE